MKEVQAKDMLANNPEKMMTLAVTGMLPHNSLGRQMAKKLNCSISCVNSWRFRRGLPNNNRRNNHDFI